MKFVLPFLFAMSFNLSAKTHFVKARFSQKSLEVKTLDDGDVLVLDLANELGSKVKITSTEEFQMLSPCKFIGPLFKGKRVQFKIILGETNRDDGTNGCEMIISRNLPENEVGQLRVFFGYNIED